MAYSVKTNTADDLFKRANDSTDYQALIDRAAAQQDYRTAAKYEQQRNAKIEAMDALGLNPRGYKGSQRYAAYLDRESVLDRKDRLDAAALEDLYRQMGEQKAAMIDHGVASAVAQLEQARADAQKDFEARQAQNYVEEAQARDRQVLYAAARGDRGGITAREYDSISNGAANDRRALAREQQALALDTSRQIADLRAQGAFEKAEALLQLTQQRLSDLWEMQQHTDSMALQEEKLAMQQAGLLGVYNGSKTQDALQSEQQAAVQAQKQAYQMAMEMIRGGSMPSDALLASAGMLGEKTTYRNMADLYHAQLTAKGKSSGSGKTSGKVSAAASGTEATSLFGQMQASGIADYENAYAYLSGHKNNYSDKQVENNARNYVAWLAAQPTEKSVGRTENGPNTFINVDGKTLSSDVVRAYVRLGMIREVLRNGQYEYHWAESVAE